MAASIDIRSRLGEGTRVTVRLPIECEQPTSRADPVKLVTERNRTIPLVQRTSEEKCVDVHAAADTAIQEGRSARGSDQPASARIRRPS